MERHSSMNDPAPQLRTLLQERRRQGGGCDQCRTERMTMTTEYVLNEAQCLVLCMLADGKETENAKAIRADMVKVLMAWRRGKLLPKWEAPELTKVLKMFDTPDA